MIDDVIGVEVGFCATTEYPGIVDFEFRVCGVVGIG